MSVGSKEDDDVAPVLYFSPLDSLLWKCLSGNGSAAQTAQRGS
jgi:hypothetical protein